MSPMYLQQDILQYCVVPVLEPQELVSFSIVSRLFHKIVTNYVFDITVKRMNNILIGFFGSDVDKIKQFMNDTGIYIAKESVLQCILNEYWLGTSEWGVDNIHFYSKNTDAEHEGSIVDYLSILMKGWEYDGEYDDGMYMWNKNNKYVCITFIAVKSSELWLNNLRSKYYLLDGSERIEIVPSYGSIIRKVVKCDMNINQINIDYTLKRLKDCGFKIDANLQVLCSVFERCILFEVIFIDCVCMDDGQKWYNYECRSGNIYYLENNCDDFYMFVMGNKISFKKGYQIMSHQSDYVCPLEICDCPNAHFHCDVYSYDCIFIII